MEESVLAHPRRPCGSAQPNLTQTPLVPSLLLAGLSRPLACTWTQGCSLVSRGPSLSAPHCTVGIPGSPTCRFSVVPLFCSFHVSYRCLLSLGFCSLGLVCVYICTYRCIYTRVCVYLSFKTSRRRGVSGREWQLTTPVLRAPFLSGGSCAISSQSHWCLMGCWLLAVVSCPQFMTVQWSPDSADGWLEFACRKCQAALG